MSTMDVTHKSIFIRRKIRARLVDVESGAVLFRHLGQVFFVEAPDVDLEIPPVWEFLAEPRRIEDLAGFLKERGFKSSAGKMVENLRKLNLLEEIGEDTPVVRETLSQQENELVSMMEWLEGKRRGAKTSSSNLVSRAKQCLGATLAVHGGGEFVAPLRSSLIRVGFKNILDGDIDRPDAIHILWGLWHHQADLVRRQRRLLEIGAVALTVIEDSFGGYVGPFSGGPGTPCFECMLRRRRSGLAEAELMTRGELGGFDDVEEVLPAAGYFRTRLADLVAFELLKDLTGIVHPRLRRGVMAFDFLNHNQKFHEVLPVPGCPSCGEIWKRPPLARGHDVLAPA